MKDRDHPFFRPLWRRIAIVAFCAAWAAWEFSNGEQFWGMIALLMAAYGGWIYLVKYGEPQAGEGGTVRSDDEPRNGKE